MLDMSEQVCEALPEVNAKKSYIYEQYYLGKKDAEGIRRGHGENHWTGAKSLERYKGNFFKNTMNGYGDYRWKYEGPEDAFSTYEGYFYANNMHGYGTMSYSDGRTFTGLFRNNARYGPGIQRHVNADADVGIWCEKRLIRLSWLPEAPYNLIPDFTSYPHGKVYVDTFRKVLAVTYKPDDVQKMNAINLLKDSGADPVWASNNWTKLFSKHISDIQSVACYVHSFDQNFYKGEVKILEEVKYTETDIDTSSQISGIQNVQKLYYAWNDSRIMLDMMKYSYSHDKMRDPYEINLEAILNGPRRQFPEAGAHEKCCRMLLMASFIGDIENVVRLVNESHVHPDVTDIKGNSAIMYATCGNNKDIIHFLVEAGANVNGYNDTCCTPLGLALMRVACGQRGIELNGLVQAILPPGSDDIDETGGKVTEWEIDRRKVKVYFDLTGKMSKSGKFLTEVKSARSILMNKSYLGQPHVQQSKHKSKVKTLEKGRQFTEAEFCLVGTKNSYNVLKEEYSMEVVNLFAKKSETFYLFEVDDMYQEVLNDPNETQMKPHQKSKNKLVQKSMEKFKKPFSSQSLSTKDLMRDMLPTVKQLLEDGALVDLVRCPQPALSLALAAGSADILQLLLEHGANVNRILHEPLHYTALDIVVSRPFIDENRDMISVLLEYGAEVDHRLWVPEEPLGPTLLHVIAMRNVDLLREYEEIREKILEMFALKPCNPLIQYRGSSVIDIMMNRNLAMFKRFNAHAKFDRNAKINVLNQNILVKFFTEKYFMSNIQQLKFEEYEDLLQKLLESGADALLPCQNGEEKYTNLFQFTKIQFDKLEERRLFAEANIKKHSSIKASKRTPTKKGKSETTLSPESKACLGYKRTLGVVIDFSREAFKIWIQAILIKQLVPIIHKYKYRSWHMIMKEHTEHKAVAFWLTQKRCLDVWNILKTNDKKLYQNPRILKYLLYIVKYYNIKYKTMLTLNGTAVKGLITSAEKRKIEDDTAMFLADHKNNNKCLESPLNKNTLLSVFMSKKQKKFNVCFECLLPLDEFSKEPCSVCETVAFCCHQCFKDHLIKESSTHPCRIFLIDKLELKLSSKLLIE